MKKPPNESQMEEELLIHYLASVVTKINEKFNCFSARLEDCNVIVEVI